MPLFYYMLVNGSSEHCYNPKRNTKKNIILYHRKDMKGDEHVKEGLIVSMVTPTASGSYTCTAEYQSIGSISYTHQITLLGKTSS